MTRQIAKIFAKIAEKETVSVVYRFPSQLNPMSLTIPDCETTQRWIAVLPEGSAPTGVMKRR